MFRNRLLLFLLFSANAAAGKVKPSAASLRAASRAFATRIDAAGDEALAPLLVDKKGRLISDVDDTAEEPRPTIEQLLAPEPKPKPTRGFQWHDPKRRHGPPPPTFAERLDAEAEATLPPRAREIARDRQGDNEQPAKSTSLRTGPERAAEWLMRKYDELYGPEDDELQEEQQLQGQPRGESQRGVRR